MYVQYGNAKMVRRGVMSRLMRSADVRAAVEEMSDGIENRNEKRVSEWSKYSSELDWRVASIEGRERRVYLWLCLSCTYLCSYTVAFCLSLDPRLRCRKKWVPM